MAYNCGLIWLIYGLLWGIVAFNFGLLGVPVETPEDDQPTIKFPSYLEPDPLEEPTQTDRDCWD